MGMKLRVEFAARIVVVDGDGHIAGQTIVVFPFHPDPGRREGLEVLQRFPNRLPVGSNEPAVINEVP